MAKALFISLNHVGEILPIAPALFTAIIKNAGHEIQLFDTSLYHELSMVNHRQVREKYGQLRRVDDPRLRSLYEDNKKNAKEDLDNCINRFNPDLIMISLNESMYSQFTKILEYLSAYNILTVVGGVFPTFAPEFILNHNGIDIVCVGDGEQTVIELLNEIGNVRGEGNISNCLVKSSDGKIIKNTYSRLADINTLPVPDFSLFEDIKFYRPMAGKLYKMLPVITDRGCPYNCGFCNSPAQSKLYRQDGQRFFRKKRIDKLHDELTTLIKMHSPEYIMFFSDTFLSFSERELSEFVEMYSSIKLPFWINTRAETVTEDKMKKLRNVGLHRMSMGVEHGNENFRKEVLKKPVKNETIKRACEIIHNVDLPEGLTLNNMVGFPLETRELAMDTVRFAKELSKYVESVSMFVFTPFRGTELRELAVKNGYMSDSVVAGDLSEVSLLTMPNFPKKDIMGIYKTFSLYVRFDESRWPEIRMAEEDTPEGNKLFDKLMEEYKNLYD